MPKRKKKLVEMTVQEVILRELYNLPYRLISAILVALALRAYLRYQKGRA